MQKYIVNELICDNGDSMIANHLENLFYQIDCEMITNLSFETADFKYEYDLFDKDLKNFNKSQILNNYYKKCFKLNYSYVEYGDDEHKLNIYELHNYLKSGAKIFTYKLSLISDAEDSENELYIYDKTHRGDCNYAIVKNLDHGTWHLLEEILSFESNPRAKYNDEILKLLEELAPYVRIDVTNYYDSQIFDVYGDVALKYDDLLKSFDIIAKIFNYMFAESEYEYIDFVYSNLELDNFELLRVSFNFKECNYKLEKSM